ncbi:hypothetical protein KY325_04705 [Candidatus Woesearchaeota archaeon]|nr:hypothetical protein [Candidatus Woesearchaeota archaeon]MBW3018434.1 hypothetical protein [Candidatus Woesearchaeota archaeon]
MKKYLTIALIIAVVLGAMIIVGCKAPGGEGAERGIFGTSGKVTTKTFIGGTQGLLLRFTEERPRSEVFDGGADPFDIEVELINDGEWDVAANDVTVAISGIDPKEFGLTNPVQNSEEDLIAKVKDPDGNVIPSIPTYVLFPSLNYEKTVVGDVPYPIRADVCYKYGTNVISELCIRKDLRATTASVCEVKESKQVQNSGAPVHIIEFTESAASTDVISFVFKIQHRSNGGVYKLGSNCDKNRINKDKVYVEVDTGLPGLECSGLREGTESAGYADLRTGSAIIRCKQQIDAETDFKKIVNIKLEYDYENTISSQVTVKQSEALT